MNAFDTAVFVIKVAGWLIVLLGIPAAFIRIVSWILDARRSSSSSPEPSEPVPPPHDDPLLADTQTPESVRAAIQRAHHLDLPRLCSRIASFTESWLIGTFSFSATDESPAEFEDAVQQALGKCTYDRDTAKKPDEVPRTLARFWIGEHPLLFEMRSESKTISWRDREVFRLDRINGVGLVRGFLEGPWVDELNELDERFERFRRNRIQLKKDRAARVAGDQYQDLEKRFGTVEEWYPTDD